MLSEADEGGPLFVQIAEARCGDTGRHSVRLGENDVEPDCDGAKLGKSCDEVGDDCAGHDEAIGDVARERHAPEDLEIVGEVRPEWNPLRWDAK